MQKWGPGELMDYNERTDETGEERAKRLEAFENETSSRRVEEVGDNGQWFKLWCSASDDDDLDALPIADFGRWCKLGAHIKAHGTQGTIRILPPARTLCAKLQVADFDALMSVILRFPHVQMRRENFAVSSETPSPVSISVTYDNWLKYQGDFSTSRVRAWRAKKSKMKRSKRRREEMRGDETRKDTPSDSLTVKDFIDSWNDEFRSLLPTVEWPVSEGRRQKIAARLKQHPTIEFWNRVFTRIRASAFLLGQSGTWKCTVDWLCANDTNALKVYEGQYEQKNRVR